LQKLAFWIVPAIASCSVLIGLWRRSIYAWYWSRIVSQLLGSFTAAPSVFALGYIGYRSLGGHVRDELSYVASALAMVGVFLIVPAIVFWGIYFSANTEAARRYFRICPHCAKRIRAPIQLLFSDIHCDECRLTTDRRGS
jgi:hypothetical protein